MESDTYLATLLASVSPEHVDAIRDAVTSPGLSNFDIQDLHDIVGAAQLNVFDADGDSIADTLNKITPQIRQADLGKINGCAFIIYQASGSTNSFPMADISHLQTIINEIAGDAHIRFGSLYDSRIAAGKVRLTIFLASEKIV